jgi:hypothetical protein
VQGGGAVPWEVEALNSDPTLFGYQPGRPAITLALPGLYHMTFGFFARKRPLVQVRGEGSWIVAWEQCVGGWVQEVWHCNVHRLSVVDSGQDTQVQAKQEG